MTEGTLTKRRFTGLSAFPLTPQRDNRPDVAAFAELVAAAAAADVDSIGALGSTGSYAYLDRTDRARLAAAAVDAAGSVPVIVGVGAIGTAAVLRNTEDAAEAGAAGVLLAPVSYQPLRDEEVLGLFEDVALRFPDLPVVLYDNPATTGFNFSTELHVRIAQLPNTASIKLGKLPDGARPASEYLEKLRSLIPQQVSIGISGDGSAARGLIAGCEVWYSVLGGLFPRTCRGIIAGAIGGDARAALARSEELAAIWELFARFGSFRVTAAIAALSGIVDQDPVYAPVRPLSGPDREAVAAALATVGRLR